MPGVILALLPNGKIQNISRRSTALFREKFFTNQQNWPDLDVSESSSILCLDSYLQGLPRQLYPNGGVDQLADWDGFRKVVDGLIKSVASESDIRGKINDRADRLTTIILELFKNTHDHARYSVDGKIIADSIRGLYARFYPIEKLKPIIAAKKEEFFNQAERYVHLLMQPHSQIPLKKSQRDLTGFLEISIFDSGPGLAAKWLHNDVSGVGPQEQLAAVMECFGKGRSSLSSGSRGFGLWKVLEELKQLKGMIRVRTNRVHALRQYAILEGLYRDQHPDGYSSPQVVMLDWRRGYTQKLSEYPAVEGTLISVLLPLGDL
ncbi:histidine kinase-, DNA gyrase B-, and HSP90-like ATPase [mine drainage metagenome]|uniref:Histidine kinase-, DNA gyrase B-, and HSP90-like ATPase n=1 Tax=mine drainage metagenome TaxID=410659 RepID=A0A1J5PKV4_9ZZZZ